MRPRCFTPLRILILAGSWLAATASLPAAEGGFSATLSAGKQSAAGLQTMSAAERTALDQLVARELALVRSDDALELPGSFVSRRTEAERKSAGLDRLTGPQLEKLNEAVASVLNVRPKPKERPRLKKSDVLAAGRQDRVHGSVTVAYGWGRGGREMWAESLWLDYYDPERGLGLGLGLSNFSGDGFYGYYPDYYYNDGRTYDRAPLTFASAYDVRSRAGFGFGQGQSFCGGSGGGYSVGRGGRRR